MTKLPWKWKTIKLINRKSQYNIIFDMRDGSFISSADWRALIRIEKEVKKMNCSKQSLVKLDKRIRESMDLVGIAPYFNVYDELIEAAGSY